MPSNTVSIVAKVEGSVKRVISAYGYNEVRMPIVEQTHLFKRAIGEVTDVVEKRCIRLKTVMAIA